MAELKREINFPILVFLTINAIIGTGIFFLPAHGAAISGTSSIIAWLIGSVIAIWISFYFAELVSMFPKSGGVYEFAKHAFGKFTSFLVGWTGWIVANITISMLIVGAIQYVFPYMSGTLKILSSIAIVLLFNYVGYRGLKVSIVTLLIFGIITIGVLLTLISFGIFSLDTSNLVPLMTHPASLIFLTVLFTIETFFGWETSTFLSEETKNPRKTMPRALILSTFIVIALTLGIILVSLGVMHWTDLGESKAPLADLASVMMGEKGALAIKLATFLAIIGGAAGWIVTTPRLLMAISRDKLFPRFCEAIHKRYKTPYKAIALQTAVTSALVVIGFGNYKALLELLLPLALIMYSITVAAVIKLRLTKRRLERPFKAPLGYVGPAILVLFNVSLLAAWIWIEPHSKSIILLGILIVTLGMPAYAGIRLTYDRGFRERFFDWFSYTWDALFPIWYGKEEMAHVVRALGPKRSSVILDYGCYTGMTTKVLSDAVGPKGTVVAVDISRKSLELAEKKISDRENVILIKEKDIIPFNRNTFDGITLVSVIDHFDNPERQLKMLHRILKRGKSISALSFGRVFYLPSPDHLESVERIESLFRKVGFRKIKISKKWKLFSEYYFIKAVK